MRILCAWICVMPLMGLGLLHALPMSPDATYQTEQMMDTIETPLPIIEPLFEYHIRDVSICKAPGGYYYLTGTTDDNWGIAEGIRLWGSRDLKNWELLGEDGFVWTFEQDGHPWQKKIAFNERWKKYYRGIWAPEIHYLKGTFWIPYSASNVHDSGLLKSVSGKPEGPYVDIKTDGPLVDGIDATLVETPEGEIYYVWAHGRVRKLNQEMSGFEGDELPALYAEDGSMVGYEGVNIFYYEGKYHLIAAEWNAEGPGHGHVLRDTNVNRRTADGRYDCMVAVSDHLLGPYSESYIALPHCGHNAFFTDHQGKLWATLFGNDEAAAPFRENPAIVPMKYDTVRQRFSPLLEWQASPPFDSLGSEFYVDVRNALDVDEQDGSDWGKAFSSLQTAVNAAEDGSILRIRGGIYEAFDLKGKQAIRLIAGYSSDMDSADRDPDQYPAIIRPTERRKRGITIIDSPYARLDGFVLEGFDQVSPEFTKIGGAALRLSGGGESVRILNSRFVGNQSSGDGGAVYVGENSSPLFINCEFSRNTSLHNGGALAIEMEGTNAYHQRFYSCTFSGNYAQVHGGALWARTIHKQTGLVRFVNCLIKENRSLLEKGILTLEGGSSLLMSHCEVVGNRGMANGAVVASFGRIPAQNRIVNTKFIGNRGGFLFEGDGFDPGTEHPWGPKGRAWTQFENNAFSENECGALLRRSYDAKQWVTVDELNQTLMGTQNLGVEANPDDESLRGKGTPSSTFPLDGRGKRRTPREGDKPAIGRL